MCVYFSIDSKKFPAYLYTYAFTHTYIYIIRYFYDVIPIFFRVTNDKLQFLKMWRMIYENAQEAGTRT